jgi:3-oxoacyl-[acyl-carrier protein] reductase
MGRFDGLVALVTGAGSGIGAAVARRLADEGGRVVLADLDGPAAAEQAGLLAATAEQAGRYPATAEQVDVADAAQVEACVERVVREHGRLDVVVHAAGVDDPVAKAAIAEALETGRPVSVTRELDPARWRRVLSVNLDGTFHVLRAALRVMAPRRSGAVVLVGSSAAFDSPAGYPHYAASKAGVHALAQAAAKEAIGYGVRVNVVAPGPTLTGMAERTPEALQRAMRAAALPYATPDQIADSVLYLASAEAGNVVGAVLLSNGGRFTA